MRRIVNRQLGKLLFHALTVRDERKSVLEKRLLLLRVGFELGYGEIEKSLLIVVFGILADEKLLGRCKSWLLGW